MRQQCPCGLLVSAAAAAVAVDVAAPASAAAAAAAAAAAGRCHCPSLLSGVRVDGVVGVFFTIIALSPGRLVPSGNLEAAYYSRAALFFLVGGISQDIPYFAVVLQYPDRFVEFMTMDGFYSARWITPGFTEFVAPIIWLVYGFFCFAKLMAMVDKGYSQAMI